MRKKFAVVGLGLAVGLSGLLVAPSAHASALCDGASCNGKDPVAMGCDAGAVTPAGATISTPQGIVELRYSKACHANWARITSSNPGTWFWVQNSYGDSQQFYVPSGYSSGWTNMVNGYPTARAGDAGGHTNWF